MHLSLNAEVDRHRQAHVRQSGRRREPGREPGRHRASASQGAITGKQLEVRPFMRQGEVLETVPGVIITQHSGEGKGQSVLPARIQSRSRQRLRHDGRRNSGEHADACAQSGILGHQLSDSGARGRRAVLEGPVLCRPGRLRHGGRVEHQLCHHTRSSVAHVEGGTYSFGRVLLGASPKFGRATCWRRSKRRPTPARGSFPTRTGSSTACCATARATTSTASRSRSWDTTASGTRRKRRPQRAIDEGFIDRFGSVDPTDGGHTYRYSVGGEWQHGAGKR